MLFQSYTGGRPAEFVYSSKGKASLDPLGEAEDVNKRRREATEEDYNDESDAGDGLELDVDEDIDENAGYDSGYGPEKTDVTMTEDTEDCDAAELDEFGEAIRKYKTLCYEDICLWIVQNPKQGGRDLLAMEVSLRHHKGAWLSLMWIGRSLIQKYRIKLIARDEAGTEARNRSVTG
jgi:hypothetical protein